jgi:hypothetical protein
MLVSELIPLIKPALKPREITLFNNVLTIYGYSSHDSNVIEFYKKVAENYEWFADKSKIPAAWRVSSARTNYQIVNKVLTVCEDLQNKLGTELIKHIRTNVNNYRSLLANQNEAESKKEQAQIQKPAPKATQKPLQVLKHEEDSVDSVDSVDSDDSDVEEESETGEIEEPIVQPTEMSDMMTTQLYYLQEENKSLQKKLKKQIEISMSQLDTQKKLMDIIKEQEELLRKIID